MFTIYKITNKTNGKIYVGKTSETKEKRWGRHIQFASKGRDIYFSNAIRKYGPDSFTIETIAEAETEEWAYHLEKMWILVLGSAKRDIGYNSTYGGEGFSTGDKNPNFGQDHSGINNPNFGKEVPLEVRIRISNTLKGKMVGEKNPFFGKTHTPEMIQFFSESQKGKTTKPCGDETKEKIRVRMVGRVFSPETKEKMRLAKLGKPQSQEHIDNAAEGRRKARELVVS